MRKFRKLIILTLPNLIVVGIIVLLCVFASSMKNSLSSEHLADRWSADGETYTQVSAFITPFAGLNKNDFDADYISEQLKQSGVRADTWTHAYSASYDRHLSVTFENKTAPVNATGVGGRFFTFHPLELISGSYFSESGLTQDRVVIDSNLAWQLFGSTDVSGMEIKIDGTRYVIVGVVKAENDLATSKADKPRIYLPLDNSSSITCIELILPNPTSNFGLGITRSAVEKMSAKDTDMEIIENTSRYSLKSLFFVISDFGTRSMSPIILDIPYWENAARAMEDYLALFLIIIIILLLLPLVTLIYLTIYGIRSWRIKFPMLKSSIEDKIDLHKN